METLEERFRENTAAVLSNAAVIAESYRGAAYILNLEMEDVRNAVIGYAERYGGCVSCRHSRAPRNAEEYARRHGTLPITMRGCALSLSQNSCGSFEPIMGK